MVTLNLDVLSLELGLSAVLLLICHRLLDFTLVLEFLLTQLHEKVAFRVSGAQFSEEGLANSPLSLIPDEFLLVMFELRELSVHDFVFGFLCQLLAEALLIDCSPQVVQLNGF